MKQYHALVSEKGVYDDFVHYVFDTLEELRSFAISMSGVLDVRDFWVERC